MWDRSILICKKTTNYVVNKIKNLKEKTVQVYNYFYEQEKTNYKNNFIVCIVSVYMLIMAVTKFCYKRMFYSLKTVNNDCTYYYKGRKYRIYTPLKKYYLPKIIDVKDIKNHSDVTQLIKSFAGPHENFHNIEITPKKLGFDNGIQVQMIENNNIITKQFQPDDIIVI